MFAKISSMRRLLSALAVTGCLLTGLPILTSAQGLPGFTLFSGVKSENQLPFRLDFGGQPNSWDRYRLRIPAKRLKLAVANLPLPIQTTTKAILTLMKLRCGLEVKKCRFKKWSGTKKITWLKFIPKSRFPQTAALSWCFLTLKIRTSAELSTSTAKSLLLATCHFCVTSEHGLWTSASHGAAW